MANLAKVSEGIVNSIDTYKQFMQQRFDLQANLMMEEIKARRESEYKQREMEYKSRQQQQEREYEDQRKRSDREYEMQQKKREYFMNPENRLKIQAYADENPQAAEMLRAEYGDVPEMMGWAKRYDEQKQANTAQQDFLTSPKAYVSRNINNTINQANQMGIPAEQALSPAEKQFKKDEWKQKKLKFGKKGIEYMTDDEQYAETLKAYQNGDIEYADAVKAFPDAESQIKEFAVSQMNPNEQILFNKISKLIETGDEKTLTKMVQEMKKEAQEYGVEPKKILGIFGGQKKYPGIDFENLFKILNIK